MDMYRKGLFVFVMALVVSFTFSDVALGHCGFCGKRRRSKQRKEEVHEVHHDKAAEAPTINTRGLFAMVSAKVPVMILDARSGKWDDGLRIPGARALSPEAGSKEIKKMLPNRKALIVTYCASKKCPASNMLFNRLKKMGYVNLIEYPEGIKGWKEAGYPTMATK